MQRRLHATAASPFAPAFARWPAAPAPAPKPAKKKKTILISCSLRTLHMWHLLHTGDQFGSHGGTGVFRTPFRSPLFSSTGSLNHVFLNPVSLEHVCFINCSLSLLPSACFPQPSCMHFPITSPSAPHNQRISSLY
jgi:hypothetical protein